MVRGRVDVPPSVGLGRPRGADRERAAPRRNDAARGTPRHRGAVGEPNGGTNFRCQILEQALALQAADCQSAARGLRQVAQAPAIEVVTPHCYMHNFIHTVMR